MNDMGAIPIPPEAAEAFFHQQESLHADHIRSIARGRRAAWWIAGSAVAVAVLEAAAIASLAPIHDVEWRLVRVDSATGVIDEVNQLREAPKTVNEANTRFALGQYVFPPHGPADELEGIAKVLLHVQRVGKLKSYLRKIR